MSNKTIEERVYSVLSKHLKLYRIIAAVIAFAMIAWLLWFAVSLFGNPFSYFIAKKHAEKYIAEKYASEGYVLESFTTVFKSDEYFAEVAKPGSEDCRFTVIYDRDGKLRFDAYDGFILSGLNVIARLSMRYSELVDSVLESPIFPYSTELTHGTLAFEGNPRYEQTLPKSILVPDGIYDIRELGEQAGYLTIYIDTKEITPEYTAEVLLEIDSFMKRGGVPYYAINLTLKDYSLETYDKMGYGLDYFRRSDIYEDGLLERVTLNGKYS